MSLAALRKPSLRNFISHRNMAPPIQLLRLWALQRVIRRSYHSYSHPPIPGPFDPTETAILSAALTHVPTHGFTHTSLALGARDAGYLDVSTNLFPKGAFSLVHYHLVTQRLGLSNSQILQPRDIKNPLGVGAKVKALTWERLIRNAEIIHKWQDVRLYSIPYKRFSGGHRLTFNEQALAVMALPSNVAISLHELASLSDEIWFLSGDTSVDTSWYTKRASLSTIYAAADLFMTTDTSTGFTETREFLDRRFEDISKAGTAVSDLGQWLGFTTRAGINVLRSKGVRI